MNPILKTDLSNGIHVDICLDNNNRYHVKCDAQTVGNFTTISDAMAQYNASLRAAMKRAKLIITRDDTDLNRKYFSIPTGRITEKKCTAMCEEFNERMGEMRKDLRVYCSPRNGYCAIDCYTQSSRDNGHSYDTRMLQSGTPRECCQALQTYYYQNA